MTEYIYESEDNLARSHAPRAYKTFPKWAKWAIILFLWGLLVFATYSLAQYYMGNIRQQLNQIQQTNETNVQVLTAKLADLEHSLTAHQEQATVLQQQFIAVESELGAVKEEMSLAGDSLSSSADTKQALGERITALSNELGELRKLIKKLEEAARVY